MHDLDKEELRDLLDSIDNGPELYNSWEINLLDSCMKQFEQHGSLSDKQVSKLLEIAEKLGV